MSPSGPGGGYQGGQGTEGDQDDFFSLTGLTGVAEVSLLRSAGPGSLAGPEGQGSKARVPVWPFGERRFRHLQASAGLDLSPAP